MYVVLARQLRREKRNNLPVTSIFEILYSLLPVASSSRERFLDQFSKYEESHTETNCWQCWEWYDNWVIRYLVSNCSFHKAQWFIVKVAHFKSEWCFQGGFHNVDNDDSCCNFCHSWETVAFKRMHGKVYWVHPFQSHPRQRCDIDKLLAEQETNQNRTCYLPSEAFFGQQEWCSDSQTAHDDRQTIAEWKAQDQCISRHLQASVFADSNCGVGNEKSCHNLNDTVQNASNNDMEQKATIQPWIRFSVLLPRSVEKFGFIHGWRENFSDVHISSSKLICRHSASRWKQDTSTCKAGLCKSSPWCSFQRWWLHASDNLIGLCKNPEEPHIQVIEEVHAWRRHNEGMHILSESARPNLNSFHNLETFESVGGNGWCREGTQDRNCKRKRKLFETLRNFTNTL